MPVLESVLFSLSESKFCVECSCESCGCCKSVSFSGFTGDGLGPRLVANS